MKVITPSAKKVPAEMQVKTRTFNNIEIDQDRGILKKTSDDTEKFVGEIKWYLKLPQELEYVRPRIFDYSLHYTQPYVRMEYYSYSALHELFLYSELSAGKWEKIFKTIKFVLADFSRYKLSGEYLPALLSMYLEKTLSRLNCLRAQSEFKSLFELPICINEQIYLSLDKVIKILEELIPKLLFSVKEFSIIHGDLCFPNIMIDPNFNFIKLIDPRGKFGNYDIYGDRRYEFAKLLHSLEGKYDYIIKDMFDFEFHGKNNFQFKILETKRAFDLNEIFFRVFNEDLKDNLREIRFIEALLFFSMIPLHKENLKRQYAMLCTAIKILNELVNIGAK
ncbi:MAG: aminoglycoside phosphotransferase family protein [Selenomonadaceae bacterium]|nr:aminoglycoside phosphotransferase family protein [Selenomonadaceae bacterium]